MTNDELKKDMGSCCCNGEQNEEESCNCTKNVDGNCESEDCDCTEINEEPEEINWEEEALKYKDLYVRNAAETENIRRRFQKEKIEHIKYAEENLIKDILPVLDNLELALQYVKEDSAESTKALAEGVKMTLKGALDVFKNHNLTQVEAEIGGDFDSNLHEALSQVPDASLAKGKIVHIIQKGYLLSDRLIRPVKVIVSSGE